MSLKERAIHEVALAVRVSKLDSGEAGTVEFQLNRLKAVCEQKGWQVVEMYIDDGVSGAKSFYERGEGARLLRQADPDYFQAVLFTRIDRVGRTVKVIYDFMAALDEKGVAFIATDQNVETVSYMGRMQLGILAVFAQLERDMTIERTYGGRKETAGHGGHAGGPVPLGYRKDDRGKYPVLKGDEEKAVVRVSPEDQGTGLDFSEADLIRRMFGEFARDQLSLIRLGERLDREGIPTPHFLNYPRHKSATGGRRGWSESTLYDILTDPLYKGQKEWGRTEFDPHSKAKRPWKPRPDGPVFTHQLPELALVTPALWDAVQAQLQANRRGTKTDQSGKYLLKGLLHCEACHMAYTGRDHGPGNGGRVYMCGGRNHPRRNGGVKCPAPILKADRYEAAAWEKVVQFCRHPQEPLNQLAAQIATRFPNPAALQAAVDDLTGKKHRLAQAKDRLGILHARDRLSDAAYEQEIALVEAEARGLDAEARELKQALSEANYLQNRLLSAEALLARMRERIDANPSPAAAAAILAAAVDRIAVRPADGGWTVNMGFVFGALSEGQAGAEPTPASTATYDRGKRSGSLLTLPIALELDRLPERRAA